MHIESNHGSPQSLRHLVQGLLPLINWMETQGIDKAPILKHAGIPLDALSQPDYSITPSQEICFTCEAYRAANQPDLGLLIGPTYHLSNYGMLGLAAMTSRDVFECYQVILENILLTWTFFRCSIYTEGDLAYLQMEPIRDLGASLQYMIERDLSAGRQIASEALDQILPVVSVEFQHPPTGHADKYIEVFGCEAKFNAKHNRIGFEKYWLEQPLPKADAITSSVFTSQCQEIAKSLRAKHSFAEHIRYHLLNSNFDTPSLDAVARVFNTTPRTIQRKLASESVSYQELLDDVRESVSTEYLLSSDLTIEEISERIGYNDAAAFSNAFKRWTGVSPTQYRKRTP
ncbi:AraC family transcriptional regulator [Aestuariicella hydrocarbonica]|uniref:AraC family transcriptional regulator n=1 Tax=Pseudomaricurvus hydrocarbonicus TaxID=1470433 RepID=A0A9E5JWU2_9GAMM|nr:AraC family transcriptional regulator [Aestuariicella hydrocarbonica]NHO66754.1 AraC family transcriptional regulator [Aestuariicella hydrocarbonica]